MREWTGVEWGSIRAEIRADELKVGDIVDLCSLIDLPTHSSAQFRIMRIRFGDAKSGHFIIASGEGSHGRRIDCTLNPDATVRIVPRPAHIIPYLIAFLADLGES